MPSLPSVPAGADAAGLQLQDSLKVMLTTGQAPLKAFKGLVPLTLPSDALGEAGRWKGLRLSNEMECSCCNAQSSRSCVISEPVALGFL